MNSKDIVKLASECGGRFELGPGDEPTTGGIMFWKEGRRDDECPSLLKFAEAIRLKERARLLLEVQHYLTAAADGSMSRNNSEALAEELLASLRA